MHFSLLLIINLLVTDYLCNRKAANSQSPLRLGGSPGHGPAEKCWDHVDVGRKCLAFLPGRTQHLPNMGRGWRGGDDKYTHTRAQRTFSLLPCLQMHDVILSKMDTNHSISKRAQRARMSLGLCHLFGAPGLHFIRSSWTSSPPSSCCSAFPSSHTLGPSITAMDGGPVESGQDMANRNQWMDQKEKITHLYAKRLLYISCWVFWTEIGLDWGIHYWLMEDCKSDMRQHFCTRTHSYGTDVGSPGQGSNLCVWEKAWKNPLATFAAGIIICACAGECNLEALGFVRCHLFCSAWLFLHLIPWWHLSWWGIKEKESRALRSNPGDGVFL